MLARAANGLRPLRAATDEHCSTQRRRLGRSKLYPASYGAGPVRGSVPCHRVISATTGDLHDKRRLSCEQQFKIL
jgi:hypothetical protein